MSVGYGLIKGLVESSSPITCLSEAGITENHFIGKERSAYQFMVGYFTEFGHYPQLLTVAAEIGEAECFTGLPSEPAVFWIGRIKDRWRYGVVDSMVRDIQRASSEGRPADMIDRIGTAYSTLRGSYIENRIRDLQEIQTQVIDRHNQLQQTGRMSGISFGFPYLDAISGGSQPGDAIVIAGVTGVGKTWLSIKIALSAYEAGHSVLYLCTEMPEEQVGRRVLAMQTGLSSTNIKLGRLTYFGLQRAISISRERIAIDDQEVGNFFKILPGGLYSRVDDLAMAIREFRPSIFFVDGAYLLRLTGWRGSSRWERMMEIMERLKHLALLENIPLIGTYQFNKESPGTLDGVAGTIAIPQLASIVMSFEFERKEDAKSSNPVQHRILKLLKGRDGETGTLRVTYNMLRSKIEQDRVVIGHTEDMSEEEPDLQPPDDDIQDPLFTAI